MYSKLWLDRSGTEDDGTWQIALEPIPDEAIGKVLATLLAMRNPYPPNLPEFIGICMREMGLPDAKPAYVDATYRRWSHPVVYETLCRVGAPEVRGKSEKEIYPIWEAEYARVCAEWMAGNRFQAPEALQIGHDTKPKPSSKETAAEWIERIRKELRA